MSPARSPSLRRGCRRSTTPGRSVDPRRRLRALSCQARRSPCGDGRVVQVEREPYPTRFDGISAEQDPAGWWRALRAACGRIEGRRQIEVVVPTGHMHALVLVDGAGRPVLPCLTLHDRRGEELLDALDAAAFRETTGQFLDASLPVSKLLWLGANHPELMAQSGARARSQGLPRPAARPARTPPIRSTRAGPACTSRAGRAGHPRSPSSHTSPSRSCPRSRPARRAGAGCSRSVADELGLPSERRGRGRSRRRHRASRRDRLPIARRRRACRHSGAILRAVLDPSAMAELEVMPTAAIGRFAAAGRDSNCGAVTSWIETALDVPLEPSRSRRLPRLDDPVALPRPAARACAGATPRDGGASITGFDASRPARHRPRSPHRCRGKAPPPLARRWSARAARSSTRGLRAPPLGRLDRSFVRLPTTDRSSCWTSTRRRAGASRSGWSCTAIAASIRGRPSRTSPARERQIARDPELVGIVRSFSNEPTRMPAGRAYS